MFDELKEVKHFHEITFKEPYNVKFFKEIKRLKSLQKAEVYLEPQLASIMRPFRNT